MISVVVKRLSSFSLGNRFCASRRCGTGGGGVHAKGVSSVSMSGLGFSKALIGIGWFFVSPPMHEQEARNFLQKMNRI